MAKVSLKVDSLEKRFENHAKRFENRAQELHEEVVVETARLRSAAEAAETSTNSRLELLERSLMEVSAGGPASREASQQQPEVSGGAPASPQPAVTREIPSEVRTWIRDLEKKAQSPQLLFKEALENYRREDVATWNVHFPPGFRARTAPHFISTIYATGKTAKEWAKSFIKERHLGACSEAREIIFSCASIDAIFLEDKDPEAINQISTEKLARKVLGIAEAFKDVKRDCDWKRPANSKTWKSKVDYLIWSRTDPAIKHLDHEHLFINQDAENERRAEMLREASLLKTRSRIAAQKEQ